MSKIFIAEEDIYGVTSALLDRGYVEGATIYTEEDPESSVLIDAHSKTFFLCNDRGMIEKRVSIDPESAEEDFSIVTLKDIELWNL